MIFLGPPLPIGTLYEVIPDLVDKENTPNDIIAALVADEVSDLESGVLGRYGSFLPSRATNKNSYTPLRS